MESAPYHGQKWVDVVRGLSKNDGFGSHKEVRKLKADSRVIELMTDPGEQKSIGDVGFQSGGNIHSW